MKNLAEFLGLPVSVLLEQAPFKNWPAERTVDEDLEEIAINYVFYRHGLALICDGDERVRTMFLYYDKYNGFDEGMSELPFSWPRSKVLEHFGRPEKSGAASRGPFLGPSGAWDRFARSGYVIHIQYHVDADAIKLITLMRDDVVPK